MNILNPQSGGAVKSSVLIVMCVKLNTRSTPVSVKVVKAFPCLCGIEVYRHFTAIAVAELFAPHEGSLSVWWAVCWPWVLTCLKWDSWQIPYKRPANMPGNRMLGSTYLSPLKAQVKSHNVKTIKSKNIGMMVGWDWRQCGARRPLGLRKEVKNSESCSAKIKQPKSAE